MKIKILMLGLILSALAVGPASAQKFGLGLEAGANFAGFLGKDASKQYIDSNGNFVISASKLGFVGGGFLCLNFGNTFCIRPELLYEQKGEAISGSTTTDEVDYIEVPVLLKFSLGTPGINPSLLIGPSFSWNIFSKDVFGNKISNINSSDIGVVAGVELDIDKFLVSGRYELGFENVRNNVNVQNGVLTFLAGYSFM